MTRSLLALLMITLTGCTAFNTYPAGNRQYEFVDRPALISNSVTIVTYCDNDNVTSAGICAKGTSSEPQFYVQTGVLVSLFGPFITASGIATAGKFIGDGLEHSGSQNSLNATQSVQNPGPWRGGYRH